jgi:hypothetical protein
MPPPPPRIWSGPVRASTSAGTKTLQTEAPLIFVGPKDAEPNVIGQCPTMRGPADSGISQAPSAIHWQEHPITYSGGGGGGVQFSVVGPRVCCSG